MSDKDAFARLGAKVADQAGKNHRRTGGAVAAVAAAGVVAVVWCMSRRKKSGFVVANANMALGQMNPLWHLGSMHAGQWGSVDNAATIPNKGSYDPDFNHGVQQVRIKRMAAARRMAAMRAMANRREGLDTGSCPEGQALGPDGACHPVEADSDPSYNPILDQNDADVGGDWRTTPESCAQTWDPEAEDEAAALVATGGIDHPPTEDTARKTGRYSATASGGNKMLAQVVNYSQRPASYDGGM